MNNTTIRIKCETFHKTDYANIVMPNEDELIEFTFGMTPDDTLVFINEDDGEVETQYCGGAHDERTELFDLLSMRFGMNVDNFIRLEKALGEYDATFDYGSLGK